jgi:hypothetical protein
VCSGALRLAARFGGARRARRGRPTKPELRLLQLELHLGLPSRRATVSARGCRVCVVTGVLLFINTIKGNVEDILCASVCVSSHKIPRAPQAAEWCLSRVPRRSRSSRLVGRGTHGTRHDRHDARPESPKR